MDIRNDSAVAEPRVRQQEHIIIFVHMPKCGGKSVRHSLETAYGSSFKQHYVNPLKKHSIPKVSFLMRPKWPNKSNTEVVYGHFCFDQFAIYSLFNPVKKAMLFRHPIDLVCSSYFYRREKHAEAYANISLIEYAQRKDMQKIFSLYLGRTKVEDLDFVGIQEHFAESLKLYERLFGVKLENQRVNETQSKPVDYKSYLIEEGLLDEVTKLMAKNIAIYESALARFNQLKSIAS